MDVDFVDPEEDEDVIPKNSELGRYIHTECQDAFGELQDTTHVSQEDEVIKYPIWEHQGATDSSPHSEEVANTEEVMHTSGSVDEDNESIDSLSEDELKRIIRVQKIQSSFSREFKLAQASSQLYKATSDMRETVNEIGVVAMMLYNKSDRYTPECISNEILRLKEKLNLQMDKINNHIALENHLMDSLVQLPKEVVTSEKSPERKDFTEIQDRNESMSSDDGVVIEYESAAVDNSEDAELEHPDEVFEDIATDEPWVDSEENQLLDNANLEVVVTQKILLTELKNTLKLRRVPMRERERVAYFGTYGKYPEEDDEDVEAINEGVSSPWPHLKKVSKYENKVYENPVCEKATETSSSFQDSENRNEFSIECVPTTVLSNSNNTEFKMRLEHLLVGGSSNQNVKLVKFLQRSESLTNDEDL